MMAAGALGKGGLLSSVAGMAGGKKGGPLGAVTGLLGGG